MTKTTCMENGHKTETVKYNDGRIVKRIYDNPQDIVPSDIVVVAFGNRGKVDITPIEHREVVLLNHHYKC